MPQLNPAPWLMIMAVSWLTLLVLFSPKTTSVLPQNLPLMDSKHPYKTAAWNWPWT